MLLDTASLYYRAFYGMPETVTAPDGTPVNAIRGLLDAIARLVRDRSPERLVACLDADWRPAFRVSAIPSYKAHRAEPDGTEQTPPGLAVQVPLITQVLTAAGIAMAEHEGYEADDIIATLGRPRPQPVEVVTGDRDLFQLVDDDRQVRDSLHDPRARPSSNRSPSRKSRRSTTSPAKAYADFAVLRGDPSDGLPGVPGIGEKTAATLIRAFGDLDGLKKALDKGHGGFPPGTRKKLEAARDYLDVAPPVVITATDVPLPDDIDGAPAGQAARPGGCSPRSAPLSASAPRSPASARQSQKGETRDHRPRGVAGGHPPWPAPALYPAGLPRGCRSGPRQGHRRPAAHPGPRPALRDRLRRQAAGAADLPGGARRTATRSCWCRSLS